MKASNKRALRTAVQVIAGLAAAVPIFLSTSGLPADVGAGATAVVVAAAAAKFANLADDYLDNE